MKKIILLLLVTFFTNAILLAQTSAVKKMPVHLIDKGANGINHWNVYVFETINETDMIKLESIRAYFKNVKGFLNLQNPPEQIYSRRIILCFDDRYDFLGNVEFQKILADNNLIFTK